MVSEDLSPLPPPTANETHDNIQVKRVKVTDARSKRPQKGLVQCNVKVRARARDRFEDAFDRARRTSNPDITKGEFFELVLAAFEAYEKKGGLVAAAEAIRKAPQPAPIDKAEGRTDYLEVFAVPPLAKLLKDRSVKMGWTLSATIEHACSVAKDAEKPCPQCGKQRHA